MNSGDLVEGVSNVMDMFSAKGGTGVAAMLEGLTQTEQGQALVNKLVFKADSKDADSKDKEPPKA